MKKELEIQILQEELFQPWLAPDKIQFWIQEKDWNRHGIMPSQQTMSGTG